MPVKLKKRTWRMIYIITAILTPPLCALVFLKELSKIETVPQLITLYLLEIAVCLLFLPSYKYHFRQPFFIGWLFSFCGTAILTAVSGAWFWDVPGVVLILLVPVVPLFGLALEPLISKQKYHLLARVICVGFIVFIYFLL